MKKHLSFFYCALFPLFLTAQPKVIISELLYDTPLSESSGPNRYNCEFVSIYNYGYEAVDISGWHLVSDGVQRICFF